VQALPAVAPPTASVTERVQTLNLKTGCCYIRTTGTLYTYEPNADLRIDLTNGATTLRTSTRGTDPNDDRDGRDEVLQEQLMSLQCYRSLLRQAEQLITGEVRQGKTIRVGVECTLGRHRGIAFAEILRRLCTHVELCHLEEISLEEHRCSPDRTLAEEAWFAVCSASHRAADAFLFVQSDNWRLAALSPLSW
jgi:hypothetical protein